MQRKTFQPEKRYLFKKIFYFKSKARGITLVDLVLTEQLVKEKTAHNTFFSTYIIKEHVTEIIHISHINCEPSFLINYLIGTSSFIQRFFINGVKVELQVGTFTIIPGVSLSLINLIN